MKEQNLKITYTITDEAPFLATHSLLPIINKFTSIANIKLETKDISLAARVLATFPEYLENNQLVENALEELGKMVKDSNANIIKLPKVHLIYSGIYSQNDFYAKENQNLNKICVLDLGIENIL